MYQRVMISAGIVLFVWLHSVGHTGGYYENAPWPIDRVYQTGYSINFGHVWVSGDLDYYHLTGDRRAREVAIEIADAVVSHMPTRYGTHIRVLGCSCSRPRQCHTRRS